MNIGGYRLDRENILLYRTNMFVNAWPGVAWRNLMPFPLYKLIRSPPLTIGEQSQF